MKSTLPPRVFENHGSYYLVVQNKWTRLTRVRAGLPALYTRLAELTRNEIRDDAMPAVIANWKLDVGATHTAKTQANEKYMLHAIGAAFVEFRAPQVTPPACAQFLRQFRDRPRTYNGYRAQLRELFRYCEEQGYRDAGTNPVDSIRTMPLRARSRYITDSELRRIKVGAIYSLPHPKTGHRFKNRAGLMLCALIDMAYLTGQRIGDLLSMEWADIKPGGILFEPSKVANSTGAKVLIEWTPKLSALVDRLKALKRADITRWVFTTQGAQPLSYDGASTAWQRAVKRAGILDAHFHDLKAKALTDVDDQRGIGDSQKMGGHSTQSQTADYIRHKKAKKTGATR